MVDRSTSVLGILIVLAFIWRGARTRQLYLTSLQVQARGLEPIPFRPRDLGSFVQQALLGRRSIKPSSFLIRAFVFVVVAVCLLPLKNYEPFLYWLVALLIAAYALWCVVHGVMLTTRLAEGRPR